MVGFSGGVTSAWCAGWALRTYPRDEVVLLWHDTKEEHPDTYRFLKEMAEALRMPITERSDGRSVTQLFYDEGRGHKDRVDLRAQEAYLTWSDTATCADAKASRKAWEAERAHVRKRLRTTAKRKVRKRVRSRTDRAKIG